MKSDITISHILTSIKQCSNLHCIASFLFTSTIIFFQMKGKLNVKTNDNLVIFKIIEVKFDFNCVFKQERFNKLHWVNICLLVFLSTKMTGIFLVSLPDHEFLKSINICWNTFKTVLYHIYNKSISVFYNTFKSIGDIDRFSYFNGHFSSSGNYFP